MGVPPQPVVWHIYGQISSLINSIDGLYLTNHLVEGHGAVCQAKKANDGAEGPVAAEHVSLVFLHTNCPLRRRESPIR
jgi:hypothetical protein